MGCSHSLAKSVVRTSYRDSIQPTRHLATVLKLFFLTNIFLRIYPFSSSWYRKSQRQKLYNERSDKHRYKRIKRVNKDSLRVAWYLTDTGFPSSDLPRFALFDNIRQCQLWVHKSNERIFFIHKIYQIDVTPKTIYKQNKTTKRMVLPMTRWDPVLLSFLWTYCLWFVPWSLSSHLLRWTPRNDPSHLFVRKLIVYTPASSNVGTI